MNLPLYQVDAFADRVFSGNPAAVCPLDHWLPDDVLQFIAAENNLSETAFLVGGRGRYHLRWMTPTVEVDLCGHATLAAALIVFEFLETGATEVHFDTRGGKLVVRRSGSRLCMEFPLRPPAPCQAPADLLAGLEREPMAVLKSRDYFVVYPTPVDVLAIAPDYGRLVKLDSLGVIVTAAGDATTPGYDFVSRFFAPQAGILEDPVTGSAHSTLVPYWAEHLGRRDLVARQVSRRGGTLWCRLTDRHVEIAGNAVLYLSGQIVI